mmetsp:Transcript_22808/g.41460  ORF Transcript_22808/g.41460 Transcript_22808/m.41460 type:complete len:209 (-) Transcript_22808:43-669(-)
MKRSSIRTTCRLWPNWMAKRLKRSRMLLLVCLLRQLYHHQILRESQSLSLPFLVVLLQPAGAARLCLLQQGIFHRHLDFRPRQLVSPLQLHYHRLLSQLGCHRHLFLVPLFRRRHCLRLPFNIISMEVSSNRAIRRKDLRQATALMVILLHNNINNKVVGILLSSNNNKVMTKLRDGIIEVTMAAIQERPAALTGGISLRVTVYCKRA